MPNLICEPKQNYLQPALNFLKPENSPHTYILFLCYPYKKEFPVPYKIEVPTNDFQRDIDISFDTFFECYNDFKNKKMTDKEERYKLYGIPGPSQYEAFFEFFNFFLTEKTQHLCINRFFTFLTLQ